MFIDGTSVRDDRLTSEELASISSATCLERAEAAFDSLQLNTPAFTFTLWEAGMFINGEFCDRFTKAIVLGRFNWFRGITAMKERHEILLRRIHANFAARINDSHRAISLFISDDPMLSDKRKHELLEGLWHMQHNQLEAISLEFGNAMIHYRNTLMTLKRMSWESVRNRPLEAFIRLLTPLKVQITWLEELLAENDPVVVIVPKSFDKCLDTPARLARYRDRRRLPRPSWLVSITTSQKSPLRR